MRMPAGYQPPKFQQFDGKGNPKQHVAHFVETYNNAGTERDLLVKQFVRSLKGNTFDWYTDIEPESIDCWEVMEREFLNRFYSTRRSVSMIELTNTRQWKEEPVVDYINRWRSLSLDCKERPTSFEELATRAHDMEISIANHGGNSPALPDPRKERREGKKVERSSRMTGKESLAITTAPLKVPKKDKHKEEKTPEHLRKKPRQQPSLKELEGKVYPFLDFDVPGILDFSLEKKSLSSQSRSVQRNQSESTSRGTEGLTSEDNARLCLEELEALDEKRLEAQQRLECYQARLSRAFNKRVRPRSFTVGDLVLAVRRPIITTHRTGNKFTSKWDGPYVVKEVYTNGAYKIVDQD
ncbi:hypothetical protein RJ639_025390, partial [Escallonia herrerae]